MHLTIKRSIYISEQGKHNKLSAFFKSFSNVESIYSHVTEHMGYMKAESRKWDDKRPTGSCFFYQS